MSNRTSAATRGLAAVGIASVTMLSAAFGAAGASAAVPMHKAAGAAAALSECSPHSVRLSIGPGSGALGHVGYPLRLTNISGSSCTLYGYPGVSLVTGRGGRQIGAAADRMSMRATLVTLRPGAAGHAILLVADPGFYPRSRCGRVVSASWIKVFPPDQYGAVYSRFSTQTCSRKSLVTMSVGTFRAGS